MQTIKYDPSAWVDLAKDKSAPCSKEVHLRLSTPGTVSVDLGSGWRNVAFGTEFKLVLPSSGKVKCSVPFSIFAGVETEVAQLGEPLTNFDKRPGTSSVERMIAQQFRGKQVLDQAARRHRAEQDRIANQIRVDEGKQEKIPDTVPQPEPEPEPAAANPPSEVAAETPAGNTV